MDTLPHWHIKREVTVGHIFTTVMLFIGIITAWTTLSERQIVQETVLQGHLTSDSERGARQERIDNAVLIEIRELRKDFQNYIIKRHVK